MSNAYKVFAFIQDNGEVTGGGKSGRVAFGGGGGSAASFRSLTANAKRGMLPLRISYSTAGIDS
jgi:hypothetical protein